MGGWGSRARQGASLETREQRSTRASAGARRRYGTKAGDRRPMWPLSVVGGSGIARGQGEKAEPSLGVSWRAMSR